MDNVNVSINFEQIPLQHLEDLEDNDLLGLTLNSSQFPFIILPNSYPSLSNNLLIFSVPERIYISMMIWANILMILGSCFLFYKFGESSIRVEYLSYSKLSATDVDNYEKRDV